MNTASSISALALILLLSLSAPSEAQSLTCLDGGPSPSPGDTDGDGIPDEFDSDPTSPDNACRDGDFDLINELREYQLGTDITLSDTDGDGIKDGLEDLSGMNPLSSVDALIDSDGDGYLNAHEALAGTDATSVDSTPPALTPRSPARYILADDIDLEANSWSYSVYTVFDVHPANRFEIYPLKFTSLPLAGDYTETATYALLTYDADIVLSQSYPIDPDTGMQVAEITYAESTYIFPVTLDDGSAGVVLFYANRVEIPETGSVTTQYVVDDKQRVHAVSDLNPLAIGAGDYAMPVVADPALVGGFVGEYWFHDGFVTLNGDGTGTRSLDSLGFTWYMNIDGVLTFDYGVEGATDYYLVDQIGEFQWVAAVHTLPTGETFSTGKALLSNESPEWPLPVEQGYQLAWGYPTIPFTLDAHADGTLGYLLYSPIDGAWREGTSWLYQLSFEGQTLIAERMLDDTGNPVFDPADCASQNCYTAWRRELHPLLLRENGSVLYFLDRRLFYNWTDADQDGVIDTQNQNLLQTTVSTRKGFRTTRDLDLDGITDSIDDDDDGDGLPDAWEAVYSTSNPSYYFESENFFYRENAATDPDQDRLTNIAEFRFGTDPLTPNSPIEFQTSVVLRRSTDQRWFSYDFQFGEIVDQAVLAGLTRNAAYDVVSRADFDGDGQPDVLVRDLTPTKEQNGRWVLYTLQGTTVTSEGFITDGVTRNRDWELVSDGDFDNDGKADLLLRNALDGRWLLYLMDSRNIKSQAIMSLSEDLTDVLQGTADFNADGITDVLLRSANGVWLLYEFDGLNPVTVGTPPMTNNLSFTLQALADFDGDDDADILLRRTDGRWFLYLMDGATGTVIGGSPALTETTDFTLAAVADFDGDTTADILVRRASDGRWYLYTMSGIDIVSSGPPEMTRNLGFQIVSTEDFTDDGVANILMRRNDGRWVLYTLDGPDVVESSAPDMSRNTAWNPYVP